MARFAVGVDFGATNLRAGVCDDDGRLLSFVTRPTEAQQGVDLVVERMIETIEHAIAESGQAVASICGVAIGACGLVNADTGHFVCSSVLPDWRDVPLAPRVSDSVQLPVLLENDANVAIFGEWLAGAAMGLKHVVGMTLGTGIGGAAIVDGRLFRGATGQAGEFGHMTVEPNGPRCYCGNWGCLGLLASATGIVGRYWQRMRGDQQYTDSARVEDTGMLPDAKAVFLGAEGGNPVARQVVTETGRYLGIGTANLLGCFNPEMVVFTGGITRAGRPLLKAICDETRARTYPPIAQAADIQFGRLGDAAGVVGAAGVFFESR